MHLFCLIFIFITVLAKVYISSSSEDSSRGRLRYTETYSSWSAWTPSEFICDGFQYRGRACYGNGPCRDILETRDCKAQKGSICEQYEETGDCICSDEIRCNNTISFWGEWTSCTVTCGNGSQQRHRSCKGTCSGASSESRTCHPGPCPAPINGSWSSWGNYSPCDKTCGNGWKVRFRKCSNPQPARGGLPCIGDSLEAVRCNTFHCPVDGQWSAWSGYGQCSSSCGAGVQIRIRNCSNPAPEYGGNNCTGRFKESQRCNLRNCPVNGNWGQWGNFRPCDMPCGGGIHIRMRGCDDPSPSYGGLQCPGQSVQTEACNTQPCPATSQPIDNLIG